MGNIECHTWGSTASVCVGAAVLIEETADLRPAILFLCSAWSSEACTQLFFQLYHSATARKFLPWTICHKVASKKFPKTVHQIMCSHWQKLEYINKYSLSCSFNSSTDIHSSWSSAKRQKKHKSKINIVVHHFFRSPWHQCICDCL